MIAAVALLLTQTLVAQTPALPHSDDSVFQAVSIKLSAHPHLPMFAGSAWSFPQVNSGRWQAGSITLSQLVAYAYGLHCCDVAVEAGSPELARWIDDTGFAMVATTASKTVSDAQLRTMVRQMLETSFQLKTHTITRTVPVYSLEIAPGGPRIHPAAPCDPNGDAGDKPGAVPRCGLGGGPTDAPGVMLGSFRSFTMAELAEWWETSFFTLDRHPIVDRTGLQGAYDFDLKVQMTFPPGTNPDDANHDRAAGAMKALESQDGLKLDIFHTTNMAIPVRGIDAALIPSN